MYETSFLATDTSGKRLIYVKFQGDPGCTPGEEVVGIEGILKKASSGLPDWLQERGFSVPTSSNRLMFFKVGEDAASQRRIVYTPAVLAAFFLLCTFIFANSVPRQN